MEPDNNVGSLDHGDARADTRIPRCPECDKFMAPVPYGWWMCPDHPWRMAPDRNHPDYQILTKSYGR